jgi:hypothetical protein
MARPVKWSRDAHAIRDRAQSSRTETWSRRNIEQLFGVGRATAQSLMKLIGQVQPVGGAHFIERTSLLGFLDAVLGAESVEAGLKQREGAALPVPATRTLKVSLPRDLRAAMLEDLPPNVHLEPGRLSIEAPTAEAMVESLVALAMVMQNDLERWRLVVEPPQIRNEQEDEDLRVFLGQLRNGEISYAKT